MNPETFCPVLCELLLKSAVLLAVAALADRLWRGASAASRHMVWACALAALLALPLTKLAAPLWTLEWNAAPPVRTVQSLDVAPVVATSPAVMPEIAPKTTWRLPEWRTVLAGLWLGGTGVLVGYRVLGSLRLRRLCRHSVPLADPRARALAGAVASECGWTGAVELRRTAACRVPMAWGFWRPVVLFPDEAVAWPDPQLTAALRHEFGHLRRRDGLVRGLSQWVCAVYWMNPLVWMAARRLRVAQEQACDDLVLRGGAIAPDYADLLVQVAGRLGANRQALAMAHPSTLEARVRAIVDAGRNRGPLGRVTLLAGVTVTAVLVAACGVAQVEEKTGAKGPPPQIQIEARIVDLPDARARELSRTFVINAAEQQNLLKKIAAVKEADMLCAPRVNVLSGREARVEVGREVPLGPDGSRKIMDGIGLRLLPTLQPSGLIDLASTLTVRWLRPDARPPYTEQSFLERKADTTTTLAPGETFVMGSAQGSPKGQTLLMMLTASLVEDAGEKPATKPAVAAAGEKAKRIVIPRVEFQEAPLDDVAAYLADASRTLDPDKKGVNILVQAPPASRTARITLNFKDIPLLDALRYTADVAGLKLTADDNALVISTPQAPAGGKPPAAIPAGAAADKARRIVIPQVKFQEAPLADVVGYLAGMSVQLDPDKKGVNILFHAPLEKPAASITLNLAHVPLLDALRYVADIAGLKLTAEDNRLVLGSAQTPAGGPSTSAVPVGAAVDRAKGITVPQLDFREASLKDVVNYLADESRTLDPDKKGVNIFLQVPPGTKPPAITLNLQNIPLFDALRFIASIGGCDLVVDDNALRLVFRQAK